VRGSVACPVAALKACLEAGGITTGPVFRSGKKGGVVGERLPAQLVADIVKAYAERVGLDPALFAGHSVRSGLPQAGPFDHNPKIQTEALPPSPRLSRPPSAETIRVSYGVVGPISSVQRHGLDRGKPTGTGGHRGSRMTATRFTRKPPGQRELRNKPPCLKGEPLRTVTACMPAAAMLSNGRSSSSTERASNN
jgi:hypothetical protein